MKIILLSALIFSVAIVPVFADSDGYYCVSDGYLAYEQASWSSSEKKHVLRVIRLPNEAKKPRTLVLDDFQVHGMKCGPRKIEILGWDKHYVMSVPISGDPALKSTMPRTPGQRVPGFESNSLNVGPSKTVAIPTPGQKKFELQVAHTETNAVNKGTGMIHHNVVASIVQLDVKGKVIETIEILSNKYDEPVH